MFIPQYAIDRLAPSIQPLVFETGVEGVRYSSTRGTVFLVGYEGRSYVLTARHALQPNNLMPICVFSSDVSCQLIPLKDVFYVPQHLEDDDIADVAVIAIDTRRINHPDVARAQLMDLALSCGEWKGYAHETQFFVLGYPEERSFLNYETTEFRADRVMFLGRYDGPSNFQSLHVLKVHNTLSLTTFSGLSGTPVFAWLEQPRQRPTSVLCGMVLRGTSQSGVIHFLDRDILLDALNLKRQMEQQES
ncbi:MAG: hypothetical protein JSR31_03245 [Nitrospira sp.]|nr:hypothetical protein [Nitrospira sp.]